jgi:dipeptidyl aminopeptidase/acylaminoacyl peptidase
MITKQFQVTSGDHLVAGLLSIPEGPERFPCVILSHGLVSSKESSKYIYLSERFCAVRIAACRFDYHGCGESGGNIAETTLTIRVRDLESVLEHVLGHHSIDSGRIGILGSSFGGSAALVEAAKNAKVKCVGLWATPYVLEKKHDDTISDIPFQSSIFVDFSNYDLLAEARKVSHAIVVHGELDEVVPCSEGKAIYENLKRPKKLMVIKGGDHTFTSLAHRDKAAELSLAWFRRYLGNQIKTGKR